MFMPTLKQLHYLTALHEHGHFGRAADACFVTQSTLSAGLRELETLLNLQLVERTKRVVRFTTQGETIARKAYAVLREATELAQMAQAAGVPLSGDLRMGVIPTIAPFWLPGVLPVLRNAYPDLRLYLREELSHVACESLARGALDCVVLALPYDCGDVEICPLFDDVFHAAFHREDSPGPADSIFPEQIDNERLMLLEDGHCFRQHSLAACDRPDFRTDRAILGTSLHTLVQMVDSRLGVTLIPDMALKAGILSGTQVIARPFAADRAKRSISLVWRRSSPRSEELQLLGKLFREHASGGGKNP